MKTCRLCAAALIAIHALWASSVQEPSNVNEFVPRAEPWTGVPLPPDALRDAELLTPHGLIGLPALPGADSAPLWIMGTGLAGFAWLWTAPPGATIPEGPACLPWPIPVLPPLPGARIDPASLPTVAPMTTESTAAPEPALAGVVMSGLAALLTVAARMRRERS